MQKNDGGWWCMQKDAWLLKWKMAAFHTKNVFLRTDKKCKTTINGSYQVGTCEKDEVPF